MKVSDLMYCYGAGVSYHIYQKPYMTKLIDCGVTTFNALLDQPTMLDREVICHMMLQCLLSVRCLVILFLG